MKKIILSILISVLILLPVSAFALELGNTLLTETADVAGYSPSTVTENTLSQTVGLVIRIALSFMGTIFLGLMVYAGILWMTASGEEEPIKKAQKIIMASVIGLVIVVSAYSITNYLVPLVINKGTGQATTGGLVDWLLN